MLKISASSRTARSGFTLVELAIVMAVSGLLFGGLFQLLSNSNAQITAQSAAQQQQAMVRAVRTYVVNNFNALTLLPVGAPGVQVIPLANLTPPPPAIPTANPYSQNYNVYVRNEPPAGSNVVSFMIVDSGGRALVDSLGGNVASLIGSDGGFVYQNPPAGCAAGNVLTSFGAACIPPANYGGAAAGQATPGQIVSIDFVTSNDLGNDLSQFLSRLPIANLPNMNTMQAELQFATGGASPEPNAVVTPGIAMGSNNIYMNSLTSFNAAGGTAGLGVGNLIMQGGNIAMGSNTATSPPAYIGGGTIFTNGGNIDMTNGASILMQNGCSLAAQSGSEFNPADAPGTVSTGACDLSTLSIGAANGTFTGVLTASSFFYSSDRRLKKDIKPLPHNMLERLLALQPVSFRWKSNNEKEIGLIAQDVQHQFPDLVETSKDNGYLSIQMGNLVSPIIEALRELHEENESLKADLAAERKEIDDLRRHQAQTISSP
jgi:prepilin-type N-terminal cleavage/methylation domain-containing protein